MKLDLATSYLASFARVASWAIVAGLVYRHGGAMELSMLMLLRGTAGLLSYASMGIAPVLIQKLSAPLPLVPLDVPRDESVLGYGHPEISYQSQPNDPRRELYVLSVLGVGFILALAVIPLCLYAVNITAFHQISSSDAQWATNLAMLLGFAVLFRTWSDVASSWLIVSGRMWLDNIYICVAELIFVIISFAMIDINESALPAALAFFIASVSLAVMRYATSGLARIGISPRDNLTRLLPLFAGAMVVLLAQLADWFYAPANRVLIDRYLNTDVIAAYEPAIQIDAGLLLLVGGLATVLLPKSAAAYASGDFSTVRAYYVKGTLVSFGLLVIGAMCVVLFDERIFTVWFADPMPAAQAILPWVMIHTVIGGAASVGRSVLFGIGRIKAYAVAAIIGGIANVVLATILVTQTNLGLKGIVLATVITVTIRCAFWMPWYTLRALRVR